MTVERFCDRLGIPRSTWYYWRHAHLGGRELRHWPAPVVDAIEKAADEKAHKYSAWGHRKIWSMLPVLSQFLVRPRWLAGFLSDGGLMAFPNVVLPGQGPMSYADVGAALLVE